MKGAPEERPGLVILAGPNGAGKSTVAPSLLKGALAVTEFVNADVIAQGLSGFEPQGVALEASEVMLRHVHNLAARGRSFAMETTLAARSLAPWIRQLKRQGYRFHLVFLWLPSADLAVQRVAERVRAGGHDVPETTVRRRYAAGLRSFFTLYRPLADSWRVYDNARAPCPRLVAERGSGAEARIADGVTWDRIRADHAETQEDR